MTLTDPREALADRSDFIGYLVGLAGLAQVVHALAADGRAGDDDRSGPPREADDFVYAMVGLASIGAAIERLGNSTTAQGNPTESTPAAAPARRWLR